MASGIVGEGIGAAINTLKQVQDNIQDVDLSDFGREGVELMRERMENAITDTGEARAASGDYYAGRILTGKMWSSVRWETRARRGGHKRIAYGYLRNAPHYTRWQEFAPYSQSGEMHAVEYAHVRLEDKYRDFIIDQVIGRGPR